MVVVSNIFIRIRILDSKYMKMVELTVTLDVNGGFVNLYRRRHLMVVPAFQVKVGKMEERRRL